MKKSKSKGGMEREREREEGREEGGRERRWGGWREM